MTAPAPKPKPVAQPATPEDADRLLDAAEEALLTETNLQLQELGCPPQLMITRVMNVALRLALQHGKKSAYLHLIANLAYGHIARAANCDAEQAYEQNGTARCDHKGRVIPREPS